MSTNEPDREEYKDIAEKVRSGEYFREARAMYDRDVHDPMTDRYWYIVLTAFSLIIMFIAFSALDSLYPLKKQIPFIVGGNEDERPRMTSLLQYSGENYDAALQRFLIINYVKAREEYSLDSFDRNQNAVLTQSSPSVYKDYAKQVDTRNPQSPVVLYQKDITRTITVKSADLLPQEENQPLEMQVIYEARLKGTGDGKPTRFQANIAFKYENIKLDETTNKIEPYRFQVIGYSTKRL